MSDFDSPGPDDKEGDAPKDKEKRARAPTEAMKKRARKPKAKAPKLPKNWSAPIEEELLKLNDLCGWAAASRLRAALQRGVAKVEEGLRA